MVVQNKSRNKVKLRERRNIRIKSNTKHSRRIHDSSSPFSPDTSINIMTNKSDVTDMTSMYSPNLSNASRNLEVPK